MLKRSPERIAALQALAAFDSRLVGAGWEYWMIAAVVRNGELLDRAELDRRQADLDTRYARYRAYFSPVGTAAPARQQGANAQSA